MTQGNFTDTDVGLNITNQMQNLIALLNTSAGQPSSLLLSLRA
jgi:hypothetical protein